MHEKRFEGDISRLRSPERVERLEVERVVDLCLSDDDLRQVLDVGTGTGLFAETFARRGLQLSGIDANPEMLVVARQFVPLGDFRLATAEALPFPNLTFDMVFLGLVLHEADNQQMVLSEAYRVARKRVCILEWPYKTGPFGPPLEHRLKPTKFACLIKKAGFASWDSQTLTNTVLYRLGYEKKET